MHIKCCFLIISFNKENKLHNLSDIFCSISSKFFLFVVAPDTAQLLLPIYMEKEKKLTIHLRLMWGWKSSEDVG